MGHLVAPIAEPYSAVAPAVCTSPLAEHTALGGTVILATEAALRKLLDEVSPGQLRLIEWSSVETVVTRVEE